MAREKIDGVIEAVRYSPEAKIKLVRLYERRGVVWSDHILLDREELVERLNAGKHLVTGRRKMYLGGVFEIGPAVQLEHEQIITAGQPAGRDHLAGALVF